ncbi:hypothetical protein [Streptomyces sp. URMC 123]|uniref:hypothetical protein n=1 Tax=Streptomyces sp. URMC 123 TaxID=3423403 RepID=UPI003F1C35AC
MTRAPRAAARAALPAELVPEGVRRLVGHELRVLASLALWAARRRHGVRGATAVIGYARGQAATLYALAFVCAVETAGMHVLLDGAPEAVSAAVLVLDLYALLMVIGLHASGVTRPHTVGPAGVRVRHGAHLDVRIPIERIVSVRREPRCATDRNTNAAAGVLEVAVGSQTSITLELTEEITVVRLLGRRQRVRTVRFHADDPDAAVAALKAAVKAAPPVGPAA